MLKIKLLDPKCRPLRAYSSDSGMDLRARIKESIKLKPMEIMVIPTGIQLKPKYGVEAQVRPRSGLSKEGVLAIFGTVDNSYRGEVKVTLINLNTEAMTINPYERIAQLVMSPVLIPEVEYVDDLSMETDRGEGGFGSTGYK